MAIIRDTSTGRIISSYVVGEPFDNALNILEQYNYKIITVPEFAKFRIQEGKDAVCSQNGATTSEEFLYRPKDDFFYWVVNSQINKFAKDATNASREDKEFFLNEKQEAEALNQAIKIPFSYINKRIPTNRLSEDEIFAQIYGKEISKKYGLFLFESGVEDTGFWNILLKEDINKISKYGIPFVRKNWFHKIDIGSELRSGRELEGIASVRGIKIEQNK